MTHRLVLAPALALALAAALGALVLGPRDLSGAPAPGPRDLSGARAPGPRLAAQVSTPSDNVLREFRPTGDYILVVGGKEVPAEIYQSERAAAILVVSSAFSSPVLLEPRTSMAETVSVMKVAKQPDGSIDLLADAVLAPQGQLQLTEEAVSFTAEGHAAALKPRPPLLGLTLSSCSIFKACGTICRQCGHQEP